ncbi:MAG: M48 family metalloprotease, partial [Cytophagales bacterium]|nr:M48 family metalloprotease [Cytophagales bacterium]
MVEITAKQEPKLFKLIEELAKEIDTQLPKKVYLTSDVNAFVFYDSSFWSMFLPIRKNLAIGAGLVNTMTDVELKAIISHEFGHFSQKTMKTGSYVYFVNQIIYHQINENSSFENIVNQFANISNYFAIFAWLGIKIIVVIQRALGEFYQIVNRYYLDLSREMEFQADEIAAKVAGSQALITALLRLDLANQAYSNAVDFYAQRQSEKAVTDNIFLCQSYVLKSLAHDNKMETTGEVPMVTKEHISRFNRSHLVIKDQWASHPTTLERVNRLQALGIEKEITSTNAWTLFEDKESTQLQMTKNVFEIYKGQLGTKNLPINDFIEEYEKENDKYKLQPQYNGFYDDRDISPFELEGVI